MRVLGIESSCDETAAAVVDNGRELLSNVVFSQIDIHKEFGGVVPEVAARSHVEVINQVVNKAIEDAETSWDEIDAIAVTNGPGLSGSLLIGVMCAKTLARIKNKPLYPVNHVLGHVFANYMGGVEPEFPLLALIVSGGHSQLALFNSPLEYVLLGQTQDDAVGEAFDKVAKIIGLPYPGGPSIQKAAAEGDGERFQLPKAKMPIRKISVPYSWLTNEEKSNEEEYIVRNGYDFSFSGLKTAALRAVQREVGVDYNFPSYRLSEKLDRQTICDFAASFNKLAIETLVDKTILAYEEFAPKTVVIAGGVAASKELRKQLSNALPIEINYADFSLCTDNGAMIASLGYFLAEADLGLDKKVFQIEPNLKM